MGNAEIYEENLSRFKVVRRMGNGKAQCICPCHPDKTASLTVSMGDRGTLFHCHAGCDFRDIMEAVGLKQQDTFYENKPQEKDWKKYVESREKRPIEGIYRYADCSGVYCFTKLRLQGKKLLYGVEQGGKFLYGLGGKSKKDFQAVYGDLEKVREAIKKNEHVFVPEGEKDVDSLIKRGFACFTYGGTGDWRRCFAMLLKGAKVVILADNDEAGKRVAGQIYKDLEGVARERCIVVPVKDAPKADISDFFEMGNGKDDLEKLVEEAMQEPIQKAAEKAVSEIVDRLTALNARRKYAVTDKGNGKLFAEIFKAKHRYNPTRGQFMVYDGRRWTEDIEGLSARSSAKMLTTALIRYAGMEGDSDYLKAVSRLECLRNRENMVKDARDFYFFSDEDLDTDDYILNIQNGTLDLSGNAPVFKPHSPDDLLSKICNVNYAPEASCPVWGKFLVDIMQGSTEKIRYLQKIAGLSLTGNTQEETCFILYGSTTRNGKSSFCETIIYLLGDYAVTMRPESLAIKQNVDSRTANGDIARLAGCRFVNASEPPKRMLFDTALLKNMLGRDSITARHLHQREFSFIPKFKLVINTNFLPTISDDTVFSSQRINVISFDRHFSPAEQDKHLKDKLREPQELSGILNWCIEGLELYRKEGLIPPPEVQKATETYRSDSDKIGNFIKECMIQTGRNCSIKEAYEVYGTWCSENGCGIESKTNFISEMKGKGLHAVTGTVSGRTVRNVIRGYEIGSDFKEMEEKTPFNS